VGEAAVSEAAEEAAETQERKCLGPACPLHSVLCGLSESMWFQGRDSALLGWVSF
jgi:hypothetical protein